MKSEVLYTVKDTIFGTLLDKTIDYENISLENLAKDKVYGAIPIVKEGYKIVKSITAFREWFFIKKVVIFASKLQSGRIDPEKLDKYVRERLQNTEQLYVELGYILIILAEQLECEKVKYYANLYLNVIDPNEIFDWYDFRFMVDILNRMSIYDVNAYQDLYNRVEYKSEEKYDFIAMKRLSAIGLVDYMEGKLLNDDCVARINELGKKFYKLCIENTFKLQ